MIMKVVIATHNKDKLKELKNSLSDLEIELVDLSNFPEIGEIPETGETLLQTSAWWVSPDANAAQPVPGLAA